MQFSFTLRICDSSWHLKEDENENEAWGGGGGGELTTVLVSSSRLFQYLYDGSMTIINF